MINYMRGSLCTLSEDGMQSPQSPRWSHGVVHAHLKFSVEPDVFFLGFSEFLQILDIIEGANCIAEDL